MLKKRIGVIMYRINKSKRRELIAQSMARKFMSGVTYVSVFPPKKREKGYVASQSQLSLCQRSSCLFQRRLMRQLSSDLPEALDLRLAFDPSNPSSTSHSSTRLADSISARFLRV